MKICLLGSRGKYFKSTIEYLNHSCVLAGHYDDIPEMPELPDCVILTGCFDIIPEKHLKNFAPRGWYMFHESDLPKGRGHAPLQWTLIKRIQVATVSFLRVEEKFDTGNIIGKAYLRISESDTITELRMKSIKAENNLLVKYVPDIETGLLRTTLQIGEGSYYPRRNPEDSELDVNKTIAEQWNLLRACENEDYPAFFNLHGRRYTAKIGD